MANDRYGVAPSGNDNSHYGEAILFGVKYDPLHAAAKDFSIVEAVDHMARSIWHVLKLRPYRTDSTTVYSRC
jgi:hypothetical protein